MLRRIARIVLALVALLLVGGATTEAVARYRTAKRFPVPGLLVDIGGRKLQIDCRGSGSPTVVLESGLDVLGSLSWAAVHDSIASTTRTCAYSRAGIMWSDPHRVPFSSASAAQDLHAALRAAGVSPPLVIVGHSIGGAYVLEFTRLYDTDVAGVVLVDASHPDQVARMEMATGTSMAMPTGAISFGAAISRTGLVRLVAGDVAPEQAPRVVHDAASSFAPASLAAVAGEAKALGATFSAEGKSRALGERPLVVLTAMAPTPAAERAAFHLDDAKADALRATWKELQNDEASWSTRSRHQLVPDAGHYIQFDRPDVVIAAVREVVSAVTDRTRLRVRRGLPVSAANGPTGAAGAAENR